MKYADGTARLAEYRRQITALREKMRALQDDTEPEEVSDYEFQSAQGPLRLSQLFGDREDLIVIHNMGISCPACTMWADGFNGVLAHITNRAAFAVSSPDGPEVQRKFAAARGWRFPLVSHAGTSFAADMGFRGATGWRPGVSVFKRHGQRLVRVSHTGFNAGDDFCAVYHLFDLLPGGSGEWFPKLSY
jgi:predicted dithiol-disulfide oxidoreductase (DUF899 family)